MEVEVIGSLVLGWNYKWRKCLLFGYGVLNLENRRCGGIGERKEVERKGE